MAEQTSTLTIVRGGGNWEAVYVDGESYYQNHLDRSYPRQIVAAINEHNIDDAETVEARMTRDDEGRLNVTQFPNDLDELYESDDYEVV